MAAEKGEKAEEKGATAAAKKGDMVVEAVDEEKGVRVVEKGETGMKAADEEKAATAVENGEEDSTAADEEEGAKAEGKGKKRETAAVEKESTTDWGFQWKLKVGTPAGGEEGSRPRRERRRWRSTRRDRGAAAEKDKEKDDTAAAEEKAGTAAGKEGAGEKTVFFFSAAAAPKMITVVSAEGQPFRMSEAAARLSVVLADMIDNGCAGGNIPLPNVDDRALAMVIKYCDKHAAAETDSTHGAADEGVGSSGGGGGTSTAASKKDLYEWDRKLVDDLTQDALFDLITAANFLDIKGLLEASCQKVADMIAKKTPAQVRRIFNIANDFTAEEEEEIRNESPWAYDDEEV